MSASNDASATKCGFVALVGAPNSGKSTLLNAQVGARVSIVTRKVQTTRSQIRGIKVVGDTQIVFIDTPGIFAPRRRLDRAMVEAAWAGARGSDVVVVIVDAAKSAGALGRGSDDEDTKRIIDGLAANREGARSKIVLALNKIDRIGREPLLALAGQLNESGLFDKTFMISALKGDGLEDLLAYLVANAPAGVWHYEEDQLSDLPERMLAAEITREKAFESLHQELPYALAVETETWEEHGDGAVRIGQVLHIEKESQKGMVVGKGGRSIKRIREQAQAALEDSLGRKVHLFIRVKVSPKWADEPDRYREWGLNFDA
ncbi:MAG: GTPase Era [Alphaproteobacteria bacterium]|nr:GTPase Era [Alphaproteobacteria bacterium]MCZ6765233.1 GTPase Era [Alphaproteobacteria bacterium]